MTQLVSSPARQAQPGTKPILLFANSVVVLLGAYGIFRLPFRFPPTTRLVSPSYIFGFNNSVSVSAAVALLGVMGLLRLWNRPRVASISISNPDETRLPPWVFAIVTAVYLIATFFLYATARAAKWYLIDFEAGHFLWRLRLMDSFGLRPYHDFHFEYGPALIYPPALLHALLKHAGVPLEATYYACNLSFNLLGLACAWYVLNRIVGISLRARVIAFCLLSAATLTPFMGLNGAALRFLAPFASMMIVHQAMAARKWMYIGVIAFVATLVNILISPEIGLAFAIALGAYCVWTCWTNPQVAIAGVAALLLAIMLSAMTIPREYFDPVLRFTAGANNFPVLPAAHILLYLLTLLLIVPALLADALRRRTSEGALILSFAALCVAMIPAALGRCDPPHVMTYQLGAAMLAFAVLATNAPKIFWVYATSFAIIGVGGIDLYAWRHAELSAQSFRPRNIIAALQPPEPKTSDLHALDKYPSLGVPFGSYGADKLTQHYLFEHQKLHPEYYVGKIGVYVDEEITHKLADLSRHEYILLPKGWEGLWNVDLYKQQLEVVRDSFVYPARLPRKREGIDTDIFVNRVIDQEFRVVEEVGEHVVMRRIVSLSEIPIEK